MGSYLTQTQFQTGIHSSSLFLTASAQVRNKAVLKISAASLQQFSLSFTDSLSNTLPHQSLHWLLDQNLLCLDMAKELGAVVNDQFFQWMAGAALPAITGLFLTPFLLYKVIRREERGTSTNDRRYCFCWFIN
jgi:DASS family divalent anion:Na+ symporter